MSSSPVESSRQCARPGCAAPASATLSFDYSGRRAWVEALSTEPDPARYDLCPAHAGRLRVPVGWSWEDRRVVQRLAG
ncbi:MAG: DUF3499 family protein [Acidimicrobiales bacterium]